MAFRLALLAALSGPKTARLRSLRLLPFPVVCGCLAIRLRATMARSSCQEIDAPAGSQYSQSTDARSRSETDVMTVALGYMMSVLWSLWPRPSACPISWAATLVTNASDKTSPERQLERTAMFRIEKSAAFGD